MKPTVIIDFDGVLHSYKSGWKGPRTIADGPVPGAIDWLLYLLAKSIQPAIYSTRSHAWGGRRAMKRWLDHYAVLHFLGCINPGMSMNPGVLDRWADAGCPNGMDPPEIEADYAASWLIRQINWPRRKPPAVLMVDDRAWRFEGEFPSAQVIHDFTPWNKQ